MAESPQENREKMEQITEKLTELENILNTVKDVVNTGKVYDIIAFIEAFTKYYNSIALSRAIKSIDYLDVRYKVDDDDNGDDRIVKEITLRIRAPCNIILDIPIEPSGDINVFKLRDIIYEKIIMDPAIWGCLVNEIYYVVKDVVYKALNEVEKLKREITTQ